MDIIKYIPTYTEHGYLQKFVRTFEAEEQKKPYIEIENWKVGKTTEEDLKSDRQILL